ncbi:MAG: DUF86 domain-containing protein [Acidobacteriota bacterium]
MPPEDRVRLLHMIEATETALGFIEGRTRSDLDTDTLLRFALVRAIEIIGEAASRMSREFQDATPDIPWPLIVAMRNRLIHAYFDIDREILWRTATQELPDLLPRLQGLVPSA